MRDSYSPWPRSPAPDRPPGNCPGTRPGPPDVSLEGFVVAARSLAALAGRATAGGEPRSLDRREIHRFLAALLAVDSRQPILASDEELARVLKPPTNWEANDLRLAAQYESVVRDLNRSDSDDTAVIFEVGYSVTTSITAAYAVSPR